MVKRCAWGTCKTDSRYPERLIKGGKVINFHRFLPRNKLKERRELWIRSCSRADYFKCTKDSYICSLHFVGENRPTDKDPNPVPATASREKVCFFCVYCMSTYYFVFSNLKCIFKGLRHGHGVGCLHVYMTLRRPNEYDT